MSLHTISVIPLIHFRFALNRHGDLTMTNSISSVWFPRFRPTQGARGRSIDAAAPNDQSAIDRSEMAPVGLLSDLIEDPSIVAEASDEALIAMLAQGRQDAIGCLFRRYARTIHAVGRRILHDPTEAEDLIQEVFLYVFRKFKVYDPSKGSARSWLIQVAYSQAFIRRRKLKALGFYEDGLRQNDNPQFAESAYDYTLGALFGHNRLKSILEDLSSDQARVLKLHFYEGYTFAEIAEKLGQTYANVRNHHYRGLEKLRRYLAEDQLNRR